MFHFFRPIQTETKSFPTLITVKLEEESRAWGSIIWDNALFSPESTSFELIDEMPWSVMKEELRKKFEYFTGCFLSDAHLDYLCEF